MRKTKKVSVWPVGLVSHMTYEGPVCRNGTLVAWRTSFSTPLTPTRDFPLDMAGFSIHLCQFVKKPHAQFDGSVKLGQLETALIKEFISTRSEAECLGSDKEVGKNSCRPSLTQRTHLITGCGHIVTTLW